LELVATRPAQWTIVSRARNSAVIPARWAKGYAVCPSCRYRQLPIGRPQAMRCDDCCQRFDIAWDQPYLAAFDDRT
jgi:hypothetical protein